MSASPSTKLRHSIAVFDAPSNLGLRPPEEGAVPGCYKLPWALRNRGLVQAIHATDLGSVVPPRYRAQWTPGQGDRNADAIAAFSTSLADHLSMACTQHPFVVVLGGDCSILIGNLLALKRRGRFGLVFIDGHSDFRHARNAPAISAAAGEDLAIVTGRGDARLVNLEQLGPYVNDADIALIGVRSHDEYLGELSQLGISLTTSAELAKVGVDRAVKGALATVTRATQGFWVHLDLDVLDMQELPAVDSPEPDGLSFTELSSLLKLLVASPACVGLELTIYDPDLDPSGVYAKQTVECLREVFDTAR